MTPSPNTPAPSAGAGAGADAAASAAADPGTGAGADAAASAGAGREDASLEAAERERDRERDRDAGGRARNARPRDGLGRPLDRTATGQPTMPDNLELAPGEALPLAQRLIDEGRPFHAHEVLEAEWKAGPADQRNLWQGLAQLAVGLTHARRGNAKGAIALLRRGANAVAGDEGEPVANLDPRSAAASARLLATRIDEAGLESLTDDDLRLRIFEPGLR